MKRNKIALSTGILLIILASFSIVATLATLDNVLEMARVILDSETGNFIFFLFVHVYSIALFLAQSIIYMIYGVKLVKLSKNANAIEKMKSITIISLILISCSFLFDPFRYFAGLYIAIIVLNICFLVLNPKNQNVVANQTPQTPSTQTTIEPEETIITAEKEKSSADMMVEKIVALKKLKDSGVLSEEEYEKMISKSIQMENKIESSDKPSTTEKPKAKRTYAKKTSVQEKKENKDSVEK